MSGSGVVWWGEFPSGALHRKGCRMNEIRRVLRTAAWRLFGLDFFRTLTVTATAAIVALIGVLLAERIFGLNVTWPDLWVKLFMVAAGSAVVAALLWSSIRRASTNGVA